MVITKAKSFPCMTSHILNTLPYKDKQTSNSIIILQIGVFWN